ncbi:hypothetical protein [Arcanobacterium phocae]|uniref:hypothetical protein n=1 Tax=Arcanobacterium phocae TaxID=131112 RepID=UPI001C0F2C11|nr:hypothetical protein [Arcanobacterium phocae]
MGKDIVVKQINLPQPSAGLPEIVWNGSRFQFEVAEAPSEIDLLQIEASFDPTVTKADKIDYLIAASSGVLTGLLNIFLQKEFDLEAAHTWGEEKINSFVIQTAQMDAKLAGADKPIKTIEQAIRHLEEKFPMASDKLTPEFGGGLQHHLRDFTHHPSLVGLVFSILSQFTNKGYGTDTAGNFTVFDMPAAVLDSDSPLLGKTFGERIMISTFNWAMHLISDMAGSSSTPGVGTGIPGPILSVFKEISSLPFFKNINLKYSDDKIAFSQWVSKLFNGTMCKTADGRPLRFDFRTEVGLFAQLNSQLKAVTLNEAIVRTFYMITRLKAEIKRKNVHSLSDLKRLDPKAFMPHDSRALTRMLTISSSTFVGANMTTSAIRAAIETGGKSVNVGAFFLQINFVGVARMGVAICQDFGYLKEDIGEFWENHFKRKTVEDEEIRVLRVKDVSSTEPSVIEINRDSRRILTALEIASIEHDCWASDSFDEIAVKQQWKQAWLVAMQEVGQIDDGAPLAEEVAYQQLQNLSDSAEDCLQALLIAQKLTAFTPYAPLGSEGKKEYQKLKLETDYVEEVFLTSQTKISEVSIKLLKDSYSSYRRKLTGTIGKIAGGIALTGLAGLATGGAGLILAPKIAVLLFGSSFAGLSGAALTSASLAAAGGGALAAGGLGMAGGTTVIAGGAATLGLASSGVLSFLALHGDDSVEISRDYCGQVLALAEVAMSAQYQFSFVPRTASYQTKQKLEAISQLIEQAEADKNNDHKKALKSLKAIQKDLETCLSKLDKFAC